MSHFRCVGKGKGLDGSIILVRSLQDNTNLFKFMYTKTRSTHTYVPGHIFLGAIEGILLVLQDGGDAGQLFHNLRVCLPKCSRHYLGQLSQDTLPPCEAKVLASDREGALDDIVEIVATWWSI